MRAGRFACLPTGAPNPVTGTGAPLTEEQQKQQGYNPGKAEGQKKGLWQKIKDAWNGSGDNYDKYVDKKALDLAMGFAGGGLAKPAAAGAKAGGSVLGKVIAKVKSLFGKPAAKESPAKAQGGAAPGPTPEPGGVGASGTPTYPGSDPAKAPPGTEWKGQPGSTPGSDQGNYYNPQTGESFHPDLNHPDPIGPHWDYRAPDGTWSRIQPDGKVIPK